MVAGDTQAIDSAFVQAWASLHTLKANDLAGWDVEKNTVSVEAVSSKMPLASWKVTANPKKLTRNNHRHQSQTDREARLAQKPGKPFRLYYLSSMAVDTAPHVITHIQADLAAAADRR